ncbi:MAG: histidine kinase dimerization/phosphoacceptor domain -containing protein [Crocinitomicaceae bacterium]|nr:histidine kinase dimerization/phosphoacceptor domain -containing protein [Crocinitomicaceae bacterium]
MINSFSTELLGLNSVNETVWAVAKHVISQLGYEDCVIYLLDSERNRLYQIAAYGPKNPKEHDIENPITLEVGEGICGHVVVSGKSTIISDTSKDKRYFVDDSMRMSEIAVPIISKGEVIGVIDSEHSNKNFFGEQDLEILETIASMVSVKIDQAKAIDELEAYKDELEQRIQESTAELKETINQLQESNEQIKQKNHEKETLLKEIHHRVKNNLQIVSSLLSLHANKAASKSEEEVFRDCQHRIISMSLIHEQLYNKGNLSRIDANKYIYEITHDLLESFSATDRIQMDYQLDELFFNIEQSVPFGLIFNEIMVNAMKHGIPEGQGAIKIELKVQGSDVNLSIEDDGKGFESKKEHDSLGLDLVDTLTNQLEGTYSIESSKAGTACSFKFPLLSTNE